MTDELQLRSLLTLAAEPPEQIQAPVPALLERARRRRTRRTRAVVAGATAGAAAVVLLAAGLPPLIGSFGGATPSATAPAGLFPPNPRSVPPGPAATAIARYRWSALPSSPLGRRSSPLLTWTGSELIEIGGPGTADKAGTASAAFSPATGHWHLIAPVPGDLRAGALSSANTVIAWTGHQLFLADNVGTDANVPSTWRPDAFLYRPSTNTWSATPMPWSLVGATGLAAAWTGRDVVLAGVSSGHVHVAFYDPATGRWIAADPALPAGHPARYVTLLAAGDRLILWSLWYTTGTNPKYGADVLALGRSGAWRNVTGTWPQFQNPVSSPAYTGSKILMSPGQGYCGLCNEPYTSFPGYYADPVTLRRTPIPAGPIGRANPAYVWTGRAIIAVDTDATIGGPKGLTMRPGAMALYDPVTGRWQRLPAAPGHPVPVATPLWTGTQLLYLTQNGSLQTFHP